MKAAIAARDHLPPDVMGQECSGSEPRGQLPDSPSAGDFRGRNLARVVDRDLTATPATIGGNGDLCV